MIRTRTNQKAYIQYFGAETITKQTKKKNVYINDRDYDDLQGEKVSNKQRKHTED